MPFDLYGRLLHGLFAILHGEGYGVEGFCEHNLLLDILVRHVHRGLTGSAPFQCSLVEVATWGERYLGLGFVVERLGSAVYLEGCLLESSTILIHHLECNGVVSGQGNLFGNIGRHRDITLYIVVGA